MKEKIRILEEEKKNFQCMIDKIRTLWDSTLLTRDPNKLDSQKKKDLKAYKAEWNLTILCLDHLETQIKETTDELLKAFQGNEKGKMLHQYAMIKQTGFQLSYTNNEVFVPDVIPGHLFYLLNILCLLSSVAMNAIKIQYEVISLFENDPKTNGKDYGKVLISLHDSIAELETIIRRHDDKSIRAHEKLENKIEKRNKGEKRKPLTQEECAEILYKKKAYYCKKKENYIVKVGITATVPRIPKDVKHVERTIQRWDQHLLSDGEKGTKPPKGYSREISKLEFERWAETLELIKYERWEKRQTPIKKMYRQAATGSQEDGDYLEEDEDGQESRAEEDMVDRLARTSKRY